MSSVFVLLPALDEALAMPSVLSALREVETLVEHRVRVLVIDDGSTDGTAEAAEAAAGGLSLEVVRHSKNRGLGVALRSGISRALPQAQDEDVLITLDCDGSHSPELLPKLIAALDEGYGMVIASRFQAGATTHGVPFIRSVASWVARAVVMTLAPIQGVRDYTCGYRAYRVEDLRRGRDAVSNLPRETGFACQLEILIALSRQGTRIREIPFTLRYDLKTAESKLRWKDTVLGNFRVLRQARSQLSQSP